MEGRDEGGQRWWRGRGPGVLIWVIALLATTLAAVQVWSEQGLG